MGDWERGGGGDGKVDIEKNLKKIRFTKNAGIHPSPDL